MIKITFTAEEFEQAAFAGFQRRRDCILRRAEPRWGYNPTAALAWGNDIEGAIGEAAVAKARKRPWSTGQLGAPDVGDDIQVRSTDVRDGHLLLHKEDPDNAPFYLVVNPDRDGMTRWVIGWVYGWEGKKKGVWNKKDTGRPCYWIEQKDLTPITEAKDDNESHLTANLFDHSRTDLLPDRLAHRANPDGATSPRGDKGTARLDFGRRPA